MPGYFHDGALHVELGEHVFATPSTRRLNLFLAPHGAPARLHGAGGGVQALRVTGQRLRANLGDAERYLLELFRALALSGPGTVGVEDEAGRRATFGGCLCVAATGEVRTLRFAEIALTFACPERAEQPAWDGVPATPASYPGTGTLQDYAAGGVPLGHHPTALRIEMRREAALREVPRARGARPAGPERGAGLRLTVVSHALATGEHLADYLEELARGIGAGPVELTGNGNALGEGALEHVRAAHTDGRHTRLELEFAVELAPAPLSTTPAPYPTTTTAAPETTVAPTTTTTTVAPTTTTTTAAPGTTTTTTEGPVGRNEGEPDSGALQSGGAARNEGELDSGALQT